MTYLECQGYGILFLEKDPKDRPALRPFEAPSNTPSIKEQKGSSAEKAPVSPVLLNDVETQISQTESSKPKSKELTSKDKSGNKTGLWIGLGIALVVVAFVLLLFGGDKNLHSAEKLIVGTWLEHDENGSSLGGLGFTLFDNGGMLAVNSCNTEYKSWEIVGDKLLFKAIINDADSQELVDTLNIIHIDDKRLILGQEGYTMIYDRYDDL